MGTTRELVNERAAKRAALKASLSNRAKRTHGSSQFVSTILPKNKVLLSKNELRQIQKSINTLSHELNKLKAFANNAVVVNKFRG